MNRARTLCDALCNGAISSSYCVWDFRSNRRQTRERPSLRSALSANCVSDEWRSKRTHSQISRLPFGAVFVSVFVPGSVQSPTNLWFWWSAVGYIIMSIACFNYSIAAFAARHREIRGIQTNNKTYYNMPMTWA